MMRDTYSTADIYQLRYSLPILDSKYVMSFYSELEKLVRTLKRDVGLARQLESPNPEDDLFIRLAVVGFSYHSPTQDWGKGHCEFVSGALNDIYSGKWSEDYGENSVNVKMYSALCLGYLLGLYQQDKITDQEFKLAEMQLSGLIMQHLGRITEEPL